jgi:hypothetical protein
VIVTPDPNLAVVADAGQIIHVTIDKRIQNDFDYFAGSVENPQINARVVARTWLPRLSQQSCIPWELCWVGAIKQVKGE